MIEKLTVNIGDETYTVFGAEINHDVGDHALGSEHREMTIESDGKVYSTRDDDIERVVRTLHRKAMGLRVEGGPDNQMKAEVYTDAANQIRALLHD